jgi:AMP phosphorylase
MSFRLKRLRILTGGPHVAVLSKEDSEKLDIHDGDRIRITLSSKNGKKLKSEIAIVDIGSSKKMIKPGELGLYDDTYHELFDSLDKAQVSPNADFELIGKPLSIECIRKKLDGKTLTKEELFTIISDIVDDILSPVEISYFVAGSYCYGLNYPETVNLTKAMIETGDRLRFKEKIVVDKHCVGGVAGNRTTMIFVPLLAAAGLLVPKTSSRAITSPAGTADTVEVLCPVSFSTKEIEKLVKKTKGCMVWGGAVKLAPADDKIIHVEAPMSIDAEGQLLASIMAKKGSADASHLIVDVPYGVGSKVVSKKDAERLKYLFERVSKGLGIKTKVLFTDGSNPIGNGIGPLLEARDVLYVLENHASQPEDLREKSLMLAGAALELAGKVGKGKGYSYAQELLESGKALTKFKEIIRAQGGKITESRQLRLAKHSYDVVSPHSGKVKRVKNGVIADLSKTLGAPQDQKAGVILHKKRGQSVKRGDLLYTLYAENESKLNQAKLVLKKDKGYVF